MALQGTDLLVVQSQDDSQLYKLRIDSLETHFEGAAGVQFRGAVDLRTDPASNGVDLGDVLNGDLYIVEADASIINPGWQMEGGAGAGTASENDRIIWDSADSYWVLVSGGGATGGLVEEITVTEPLHIDDNPTNPVIRIDEATTTDSGVVVRLATADDVGAEGTGDNEAVVTADLLKQTNTIVNDLQLSPGGVTTVSTTNAAGNSALTVGPTSGAVVIELATANDDGTNYGVVQIASESDIENGTAGASAVVTAAHLQELAGQVGQGTVQSIAEGGTDIVAGALEVSSGAASTIGVRNETFVPFNFANLPDIQD